MSVITQPTQKFVLTNDIRVLCMQASSFPEGVKASFQQLEKIVGNPMERIWYGISFLDDNGKIVYKAAANELHPGEAEEKGCESFIIKKGNYLTETIVNWHENIPVIGQTFQELLKTPMLDNKFPCIEWYKTYDEVMLMVKLKDE